LPLEHSARFGRRGEQGGHVPAQSEALVLLQEERLRLQQELEEGWGARRLRVRAEPGSWRVGRRDQEARWTTGS